MKLATVRRNGSMSAVKLEGEAMFDLGVPDVGQLLALPDWRETADAATEPVGAIEDADFAPLVPRPSKIVCVGMNYRSHIQEMGRELPPFPTLFAKFADSLIGANDTIVKPPETEAFDWEAELAVVIGGTVRRATVEQAESAIAGFTILNDISARDWQFRTQEWLQGKTWEASTPVGPCLVTADELPGGVRPTVNIGLQVDGEQMQSANTSDLVFDPVDLVAYISTVVTLNPGDIIATGTPAGVGHARTPPRYLRGGELVEAEIAGIGRQHNYVVAEAVSGQ